MGELGLGFDNILGEDEISSLLFENNDNQEEQEEEVQPGGKKKEDNNEDPNNNNTAEVDPDELFEEDEPESVGSGEKNKQGKKEETAKQEGGASPNFFSSIATAFVEEGLFPDLDQETIDKIKTAQDLSDAVKEQIRAGLTEQQRRVSEALDNGAEPDKLRQYEGILGWLEAQEENIDVEGEAGDDLRKRIILQDYINKGFKEDRAKAKVNKIFEDGLEKEEAKEALQSLKAFYQEDYQKYRNELQAEAEEEEKKMKEKAERVKKSIIEENKLFGDIEISKQTRQAAFEAISKPIYKDPKTGDTYTAVQKLELDNGEEFLAKLGLLYVLTDGFTSINGLVEKKVKKEVKRGFSDLESKINNTSRNFDGSLNFASGVNDDNSFIRKGMKLDL